MRLANTAFLAGGVGFAVSVLVGCGSGGTLLSSGQASQLVAQLNLASQALDGRNCQLAASYVASFRSSVDGLRSVDGRLVNTLSGDAQAIQRLAERDCPTSVSLPSTTPAKTTTTRKTKTATTTRPTTSTTTPTTPTTTTTTTTDTTPTSTTGGTGLPTDTTPTTTTPTTTTTTAPVTTPTTSGTTTGAGTTPTTGGTGLPGESTTTAASTTPTGGGAGLGPGAGGGSG